MSSLPHFTLNTGCCLSTHKTPGLPTPPGIDQPDNSASLAGGKSATYAFDSQDSAGHELSTLTSARMPDHASKILVPRYNDGHQRYDTLETISPSVSSPPLDFKTSVDFRDQEDDKSAGFTSFAWRVSSSYFAYFLCVTATVLPHLMSDFNITFMTGSLFYAASTLGFITGTVLLENILTPLGRIKRSRDRFSWIPHLPALSKSLHTPTRLSALQSQHLSAILSSILHGMFFVIMGTRGGFPAVFVAYAVAAFARAILTGSLNAFLAIAPKHLGYAYAFWGFGSVVSPLVCQVVVARGVPWFQFYLGSLVASALNVAFLAITFRPTLHEFSRERREAERERSLSVSPTSTKHEHDLSLPNDLEPENTLRLALSQPFQWIISGFVGLAVASETTSQCFMVSYLLQVRNGNPETVGYVTSGFFAGITIGRLVWGYFTDRMAARERKLVIEACMYASISKFPYYLLANALSCSFKKCLVMQLLIWFVRSIAVNSFALAVIGLAYGPIFPACLKLANDMLPEEVRMVSMALISSSSSIGSALLPFITGIILNQKGAQTLPYTNVALTAVLACFWACLPTKPLTSSPNIGRV